MTAVNQCTKKATTDLSPADIVRIDSLVKQGLYKSREDYLQQKLDLSHNDDHNPEWHGAPVYLSLRMH